MTDSTNRSIHSIITESKGINGVSLFDHLVALFERITKVKDDLSTYDRFEILSDLVKKTHFVNKEPKIDKDLKISPDTEGPLSDYTKKFAKLLEVLKIFRQPVNIGTKQIPKYLKATGFVQNVVEDFRMLRVAGIDFGKEEVYKLSKSLLVFEN